MTALETNTHIFVNEYLEHFGVKGMRWGIRKEDSGGSSRREAKATKLEGKAAQYDAQVKALKGSGKNYTIMQLREKRDLALSDAKAIREGKLTKNQKKVLIGAGVAVGILAAAGTAHLVQSGKMNSVIMRGKQFVEGRDTPFKVKEGLGKRDLSLDDIKRDVIPQINPGFGKLGTKMNCRRCTFAYELRRRGYDVAATRTTTASGQTPFGVDEAISPGLRNRGAGQLSVISRIFKDLREQQKRGSSPYVQSTPTYQQAIYNLHPKAKEVVDLTPHGFLARLKREMPDRARGELTFSWMDVNAGHSVVWEIIDGVPHVFDTQSGKDITKGFADGSLSWMFSRCRNANFMRLDDLELDPEFISRWAKDAD